jgi:tubulin polyglutamylase TTLL6/13
MEKNSLDGSIIVNIANTKYEIIKSIISKEFGWTLSSKISDENWDVCWQDFGLTLEKFTKMRTFQKINHFPGMSALSRKNNLAQNLNLMLKAFPEDYEFFPETWVLPKDLFELKYRTKFNILIIKPEASCQGKGITLVKKLEDIPERCIIQRYISTPFLIDGLKFDLRLYVLITGCDPLRIFLHKEGLVRFATDQYIDPRNNLENHFMHLTNYAINKKNPKFQFEPDSVSLGHKRRISWLLCYLQENGHDSERLWDDISCLVTKTIISGTPYISHLYRTCHPDDPTNSMCFEVLGFDVIIDNCLKPWLLEVNHSPSFTTEAQIDCEVKKEVIQDTLKLLNITKENRDIFSKESKNRLKDRNSLKINEYKKWKDKERIKWKFQRDVFEQQQDTGFKKIYPNSDANYLKFLEVANQIWFRYYTPKKIFDEDEINKTALKKKLSFPKLKKKLESLSKKKLLSPAINELETQIIFKALPVPRKIKTNINSKPRKIMNSTGNFLIPKVLKYMGMPAPEENKSFMKWKLVKQNLIDNNN